MQSVCVCVCANRFHYLLIPFCFKRISLRVRVRGHDSGGRPNDISIMNIISTTLITVVQHSQYNFCRELLIWQALSSVSLSLCQLFILSFPDRRSGRSFKRVTRSIFLRSNFYQFKTNLRLLRKLSTLL